MPTPVKEAALKYAIPVYQPLKVRAEEFVKVLEEIAPDIIVVAAFGQIISKEILELPKYGCINVHASLLPKYRGAAPIQWAVIDGEKESGVTIMQMDEGLDTGDMLAKAIVPLDGKETGGSLFDKLSEAGGRLCVETLAKLEKGEITPEKQGESPTAYASMLNKMSPFFSALFAVWLLKETITWVHVSFLSVAFVGCAFILKPGVEGLLKLIRFGSGN